MRSLLFVFIFCSLSGSVLAQLESQEFYQRLAIGKEYYDRDEIEESIRFFSSLYNEAKKEYGTDEIYSSGYQLLNSFLEIGKVKEANELSEELITDLFDGLEVSQKERLLNRHAWTLINRGKYAEALTFYDQATNLAIQLNDSIQISRNLSSIGVTQVYLGNYSASIKSYEEALKYSENNLSAKAYASVGLFNAYNYNGEIEKGYPFLAEAYEITSTHNLVSRHKSVLLHLTNYHYRQNNLRKAFSFGSEGLELSKATSDSEDLALYYRTLGNVYRDVGNVEQSIEYFNASIEYYESTGNHTVSNSIRLSLANTLIDAKEYELAEQIIEEIFQDITDSYLQVLAHHLLAITYFRLGKVQESKKITEQGVLIALQNNTPNAHWIKGDLLRYPDSLVSQKEKLDIAREVYMKYALEGSYRKMFAERKLARSYEPLNPDSAFKYAYLSIDNLEDRRYSISSSSIKNLANSEYQDFYYTVADWEITYNNDYSRAYKLFEQSKSRTLFDQVFEHQQGEFLDNENPLSFKVFELQKKIDQAYQKLGTESAQNSEELSMDISLLELEYETLIDSLIASNPELGNLEYPKLSSLDEAQSLLDGETVILNYGLTDDELYLFFITKDEVDFIEVYSEMDFDEKLSTLVNNFRDAIINQEEEIVLQNYASELSTYLIDPIKERLTEIEHIVIIPDGPLHLLPFEALNFNDEYLIEQFVIKYMPSVSVYQLIESSNSSDFERDILGIAGSGFESGNDLFGSSSQSSFATLPHAITEVEAIADDFKDVLILKNEEVTEATFKNIDTEPFRFIHFATHGQINEFEPTQSGLILSKKLGTELLFGEDGHLNAREIAQLDISAELVVLSACDTGTGKVINGEGVMGLQRSFLIAGASSVLVSLWSIFDNSTPIFMDYFYEKLLENEDEDISFIDKIRMFTGSYESDLIDYKTKALQQAKIEMIGHPYYDHPVHWAPFVLTGR